MIASGVQGVATASGKGPGVFPQAALVRATGAATNSKFSLSLIEGGVLSIVTNEMEFTEPGRFVFRSNASVRTDSNPANFEFKKNGTTIATYTAQPLGGGDSIQQVQAAFSVDLVVGDRVTLENVSTVYDIISQPFVIEVWRAA